MGFCTSPSSSASPRRIPACFGRGCNWVFPEACIRALPWRIVSNLWRGNYFQNLWVSPLWWSWHRACRPRVSSSKGCFRFWGRSGRCCGSWWGRGPCRLRPWEFWASFGFTPYGGSIICKLSELKQKYPVKSLSVWVLALQLEQTTA